LGSDQGDKRRLILAAVLVLAKIMPVALLQSAVGWLLIMSAVLVPSVECSAISRKAQNASFKAILTYWTISPFWLPCSFIRLFFLSLPSRVPCQFMAPTVVSISSTMNGIWQQRRRWPFDMPSLWCQSRILCDIAYLGCDVTEEASMRTGKGKALFRVHVQARRFHLNSSHFKTAKDFTSRHYASNRYQGTITLFTMR
jgi:hypothetical protein